MPNQHVVLETDKGEIELELFNDKTPRTAGNFAKLVSEGFYNGVTFHRVIPQFVIQGGCPNTKPGSRGRPGTGGPGYNIDCELVPGLIHDRGMLSMAHAGSCKHDSRSGAKISGSCSNGSQFFICLTREHTKHLDMVHTVFGKVVRGMDVVDRIQGGDRINKARII
ncbi:MAG: peptidylprolyl isomerase [Thermoplasmata archaeon]